MEFSYLPEHTPEGPWISPIGEELTPPEAEFTPRGPEFSPPGEEFPPDGIHCPEQPVLKKLSKRYLAAFLLLIGLAGTGTTAVSKTMVNDLSPTPSITDLLPATVPPAVSEPIATTEETAQPALASVHILVYGGYWEAEQDVILLDETMPENEVETLEIPQPETQPGYLFLGYALLHKDTEGNQFDQNIQKKIPEEIVKRCERDSSGLIQVRLQGVWCAERTERPFLPLTLDPNDGDEVAFYDAASPKLSGTTVYLAGYPTPSRPGWRFLGWYTEPEAGERVFRLLASDFYGNDGQETDWRTQRPVTVYAHWEPMN